MKLFLIMLIVAIAPFLASCGGPTTTYYAIGGMVSGLSGTGLVLQNNSADNLAISANGPFTFSNPVAYGGGGGNYNVTVLTQPTNPAQTCAVTYGATGTVTGNVTNVQVTCTNNTYTIGGTVAGLSGAGLVLQDNAGNNLPIAANGTFTFSTPINKGGSYNVTVLTQPSGPAQICGVTNGFGTNLTGNATDILVTCITTTISYTIGGTVSGLSGTGLVLQNNSGNNLSVSTSGNFVFSTAIASGSNYSVTVLTQPSGPAQTCAVVGGGGTANANITGILVTCTTPPFTIAGTISGLTGTGLVLQDNGGNNLSVTSGSPNFAFPIQVASGTTYAVTVLTQPTDPNCSVTNGSGTVAAANVTNISIACSATTYNISVTVSGLSPNTSVALQDNGGDNLTISTNGITTNFDTPIATGAAYAVTVLTQPAGATCTVGAGSSGTVAGTSVSLAVTCGTVIAAGALHTCAVTSAEAVLCWGSNEYGQLGNDSTDDSTTPVAVTGLSTGVAAITAGDESTCALTNAGAVWCWGYNATGQLGNGTFSQSNVPVQVLNTAGDGPLGGIVSISAGKYHMCAVTYTGAALCWGDNSEGELGNGVGSSTALPVVVPALSSGVAAISAGSYFTCAVKVVGNVLCWGKGDSGQVGDGTASSTSSPVTVLDSTGNAPLGDVVAISTGSEDTCAMTSAGTVLCWGANNAGQLGIGTIGAQSNLPVEVLDSGGQSALIGVAAIASGTDNSCALTRTGEALCWGANGSGQLGNGTTSSATRPVQVSGLSSGTAAIAVGAQHACGVTGGGADFCWGLNSVGQLDIGDNNWNNTTSPTPLRAVGMGNVGSLQLF